MVTGQLAIKVEDLKTMFKDKQLPPAQRATANKDVDKLKKAVLAKADAYLASSAFRSTARRRRSARGQGGELPAPERRGEDADES